jgi:beta-glucosidase
MQEGGASPFELQMTLSDGAAISDEMIDNLLDQRLELAYFCERNTPKAKNDEIAALSYAAARDSIVLLKNQNVLPIKRGERVALVGDIISASEEGSFRGFVDELSKRLTAEGMVSVGYAPGYILSRDRSEDMIPQAVNLCKGADTVLVFVGLGKAREAGLQKTHRLSLPANQKALISALVKLRKKVVCVVVGEHLPAMSFDKRAQATLFIPSQGKGVVKGLTNLFPKHLCQFQYNFRAY